MLEFCDPSFLVRKYFQIFFKSLWLLVKKIVKNYLFLGKNFFQSNKYLCSFPNLIIFLTFFIYLKNLPSFETSFWRLLYDHICHWNPLNVRIYSSFSTTNIYCHCCCCCQYYYETCEKWPVVVAVHRNARVNSFEILLALMSHQSVFSERKTKRHSKQLDSYFVFIFDECVDFRFSSISGLFFSEETIAIKCVSCREKTGAELNWQSKTNNAKNEDMGKSI